MPPPLGPRMRSVRGRRQGKCNSVTAWRKPQGGGENRCYCRPGRTQVRAVRGSRNKEPTMTDRAPVAPALRDKLRIGRREAPKHLPWIIAAAIIASAVV